MSEDGPKFDIWMERTNIGLPAEKIGHQPAPTFREACDREFARYPQEATLYDSEDLTYCNTRLYPTEKQADMNLKNRLWQRIRDVLSNDFPITNLDRFYQIVTDLTDEVFNFSTEGERKSTDTGTRGKKNMQPADRKQTK